MNVWLAKLADGFSIHGCASRSARATATTIKRSGGMRKGNGGYVRLCPSFFIHCAIDPLEDNRTGRGRRPGGKLLSRPAIISKLRNSGCYRVRGTNYLSRWPVRKYPALAHPDFTFLVHFHGNNPHNGFKVQFLVALLRSLFSRLLIHNPDHISGNP